MPPTIRAERILVRGPNWVGDAVMATPFLRCLRRNYPEARITLLVRPYVRQVFQHNPSFDEMAVLANVVSTVRRLRPRGFDLAVLMVHSFHGALLARLVGARRRVGYTRGDQALLLTDPLLAPRDGLKWALVPKLELYAGLARHLGCQGWEDQRQELFFSRSERLTVEGLLRAKGVEPDRPLVAICPGAGYGTSKYWYSERFAAVADALARRHGAVCYATAAPGESAVVEEIAAAMRAPLVRFAEDEMDLGLLKPLVAATSLMIATDSGPRHYAVAFDVPVVVLMGPTDPRKTASGYERTLILRQDVACGPCYRRVCPTDHRCMERITIEQVLAAADALMGRYGAAVAWVRRLEQQAGAQASFEGAPNTA